MIDYVRVLSTKAKYVCINGNQLAIWLAFSHINKV